MTAFFILLGVALVPFGAYFALIVLPYAFGLTIRAGRRWNPDLRWVRASSSSRWQ